jgi:hypothetical protein
MSAHSHKWAREQIDAHPEWSTVTRFLLRELADFHRSDEMTVWPSRRALAERMDVEPKTVSRHLRVLEESGVVETSPGFRDNGSQTSNRYALKLTPLPSPGDPPSPPESSLEVSIRSQGVSTSYFHAGSKAPPSKRTVGSRRKARKTGHPDDDFDPANAEDLQEVPAPLPEGACPETFERTATRTGNKALCEHFGILVLGRKWDSIESAPLATVIKSLQQELDNDVIHGMIHAFAESDRPMDVAQWRLFAARKSTLHQRVTRQVIAAAPVTEDDYAGYDDWKTREMLWQTREREAASTAAVEVCKTPATHHEEN